MVETDVAIIGGGPGGYVAAIRAAQLGLRTVCIEKGQLGGVCLNVGCIPTKALIRSAELFSTMKQAASFGIHADNVAVDYPAMVKREQTVVKRLVGGVGTLLKSNGVQVLTGAATFEAGGTLGVTLNDGRRETVKARDVIIATGSAPSMPPVPGTDLPGVVDSTGVLALDRIPERLTIVGGGIIGVEFGCMFASLGSAVTIVEMLPSIISTEDDDVIHAVDADLRRLSISIMTNARLKDIRADGAGQVCSVEGPDGASPIAGDCTLVATGRSANTRGLGLEHVGVTTSRGWIQVDDHLQTNVPHIYAVGDVNGRSLLAHAAYAQGAAAAEVIAGHKSFRRLDVVPACIYTIPEVASIGLTERAAREQHTEVQVGTFPFAANGKAQCAGDSTGFVKVIAGPLGEILGVHIYGHEASSLIMEAVQVIQLEGTLEDLYSAIHPHPTLTEAIAEAALAADGIALHWPKGRAVRLA